MQKLKLDVETLVVESFDTARSAGQAGTVRANEEGVCPVCCCYPCCCSGYQTCNNTCQSCPTYEDPTCLSCEYTCQNEYTCAYWSCYTCEPCQSGEGFSCPPYCDM